jgi:transcriptional regulator with XRE-family HTH domain
MATIHEKIRLSLKDRGLSVRSGAEKCGIKYRTLHSALADERDISFSMLERLSAGLGIDFAYFSDSASSVTMEVARDKDKGVDGSLQRLRLSFDRTFREAAYAGRRASLESFLNWWVSHSGRLENFDQLAPHIDLFDPPHLEVGARPSTGFRLRAIRNW